MTANLATEGFCVTENVLDEAATARLRTEMESADSTRRGGIRNLLEREPIQTLANSDAVRQLVEPILGKNAFAARGILFDKTPDANWLVPFHQDLTIAVREKRETPGFGAWSIKDGVTHVQPPVTILETMLTVRLHLDTCDENNSPLRVLPGSHSAGRLMSAQIAEWRQRVPETVCLVPVGGAFLMRPLLLHASSPALLPARRRVIHLEFAVDCLPNGLEWAHSR